MDEKKLFKIKKLVVKANSSLSNQELLNWAMNQLFRAAREIDLIDLKRKRIVSVGCDATAECILDRLKKTKSGLKLIQKTNPKLLL